MSSVCSEAAAELDAKLNATGAASQAAPSKEARLTLSPNKRDWVAVSFGATSILKHLPLSSYSVASSGEL